ncbi:MAG: arylsulfotransferase family protein, partial [Desulfobacterales bacterium]
IPYREALREMKCGKNRVVQDTEVEIDYEKPDDLPQGFEVFPDGSVLFNDGDPGNGMQKLDFDSNPVWVRPGKFNHCIADQKGGRGVWTIESDHILRRVNTESGESMEKIRIMEIMLSNPDTDVLSLRYDDLDNKWLNDRWHFNDADPLPEEYEDEFSEFEAGDLLLSSRSLNAVMVVEPESKKIKWLKTGSFSRQHDPDWQKNGTITVYDNQTRDVFGGKKPGDSPRFSRILQIDPDSGETRVVYDGQKDRFYSRIRGKHQILPDGSILITSSEQGRIMVVNQEGETIFEFINSYSGGEVLLVSEAVWVPRDFFDFDPEKSKES